MNGVRRLDGKLRTFHIHIGASSRPLEGTCYLCKRLVGLSCPIDDRPVTPKGDYEVTALDPLQLDVPLTFGVVFSFFRRHILSPLLVEELACD